MPLELKILKVGDSLGVVLPEEALAILNVREGDSLTATDAADGSLRLTATNAEVARQLEKADDIMQRYRNTLRELAK